MDVVFPSSLGVPVMKLIQELQAEPNAIQRRIDQTIQLQQSREEVYNKAQVIHENIKKKLTEGQRRMISPLVTKS